MNTASLQKAVLNDIDIAWIIALYRAIHGGDPFEDAAANDVTELVARGLVGQLAGNQQVAPATVVENLAKLGFKVSVVSAKGKTEIKGGNDLRALIEGPEQRPPRTVCIVVPGYGEFCWTFRYIPKLEA